MGIVRALGLLWYFLYHRFCSYGSVSKLLPLRFREIIHQGSGIGFQGRNGGIWIMLCWNIHLGKTDECQDISGCYVSGSGCLDLKIVKFQDRVHQLFFPNEASRKKALECGHWYFDNYLFIIKPWDLAMEEPKTLKVFLRHVCTLSILHIYPVAIIRLKLARL